MSDRIVIRLDGVSKRYRAGRSRTVVDLIASKFRRGGDHVYSAARGKVDANVWAMKDVSLDVTEGAGLGVIGSNGAGKTTLLKLISRVTWTSNGRECRSPAVSCRSSSSARDFIPS
jgi:lipopolysaccharide transport system ATP-binding protein